VWRIVFDYGNRREYITVKSSKWAADLIANEYRFKANLIGSKINIYVEEI